MATPEGLRVAVLEDPQPQTPRPETVGPARSPQPQAKRIHLQQIQVGRDYGQEIEVVSGLQGWEYVVLNPGDEVLEGALVRPVAAAKAAEAAGQRRR